MPLGVPVIVAAAIAGFVPRRLFVAVAAPDCPLAMPVAALTGTPVYVSGAGVHADRRGGARPGHERRSRVRAVIAGNGSTDVRSGESALGADTGTVSDR